MKEKEISARALAEKMNVSPQYVSEVANERKNVTLAVLVKFADALDVPLAALLDGYYDNQQLGYSSFNCPYCGNTIRVEKDSI